MQIPLTELRGLEREREIPFDELIEIIEQAIQQAYIKHALERGLGTVQPGDVNVTVDRKSGEVTVMVPEHDDEDNVIGEAPVNMDDFGRIAASAAKQVKTKRKRDIADDE